MATLGNIVYDRCRAVREGRYLKELVTSYSVTNLNQNEDEHGRVLFSTVVPGLPDLWAAPDNFDTLGSRNEMRLVAYDFEPAGPFNGYINCRYVNVGINIYRGGTGLETVQTDSYPVDQPNGGPDKGEQILVEWQGAPSATPPVPPPAEAEQTQSGVITVTSPQSSLLISRIEPGTYLAEQSIITGPGTDPGLVSKQYVNKTNSVEWSGGDPGTWLCENVSFDSNGMDGIAWLMTYEFRFREEGWDQDAVYIWRETGEPAPGLVDGEGRKTIRIQGQINFENLGFIEP